MRTVWRILLAGIFSVSCGTAYAGGSGSGPFEVTVDVQAELTLTVTLRKNSSTGSIVTSMDFGSLVESVPGELRSSTSGSTGIGSVVAMVSAKTGGVSYVIRQTGTALSSGDAALPAGACTVVPVYSKLDNGGANMPSGATLGAKGSWVATDKVLYQSDSKGKTRVTQNHYSITGDPSAGAAAIVPVDQEGGVYSATVTFTITT